MNTKQVIQSILKENTGTHMLDSGGAYGRHWEKNQKRNFDKEKPVNWDKYCISRNIYHYLLDNLKITNKSESFQKMYDEFIKDSYDYYLTDMGKFSEYLIENNLLQNDNYLMKNNGTSGIVNTYNYECLLSQILQYIIFFDGQDYFIILQVHNGCDVRGGYTRPKIFQLLDAEQFYFQQRDITIYTKKGNNYFTDDTYHFYKDGSTEHGTFEYEAIYKEGIESAF